MTKICFTQKECDIIIEMFDTGLKGWRFGYFSKRRSTALKILKKLGVGYVAKS